MSYTIKAAGGKDEGKELKIEKREEIKNVGEDTPAHGSIIGFF